MGDQSLDNRLCVVVVIPCFRVSRELGPLLRKIGPEVSLIYCVDDHCPEDSGAIAQEAVQGDPRIRVLVHERNMGVGAAVVTGYKAALDEGADIIVKLDGDGQMNPAHIPQLIAPLLNGEADYTKGNRFYRLSDLREMPLVRLFGNAVLSFFAKMSTGYWTLFDPNNGFTAIHATVARSLELGKVATTFFFESDLLFRLNLIQAVVAEVPMPAYYGNEKSNLKIWQVLASFPGYHGCNLLKRLFYNYFLRNFSIASLNLVVGTVLMVFGVVFGGIKWLESAHTGTLASSGTIMLSALPIIIGMNLSLSFLNFDMSTIPSKPIHKRLSNGHY